jgi:hypothetical protein
VAAGQDPDESVIDVVAFPADETSIGVHHVRWAKWSDVAREEGRSRRAEEAFECHGSDGSDAVGV